MQLKTLFQDLDVQIIGEEIIEVRGISSHSKQVQKNDLFIARSGEKFNGLEFAKEAIEKGAVAILTSKKIEGIETTQILHSNPYELEARLSAKLYGYPSQKLKMIGLTGTNGKSTTSYLIKQLLGKRDCGMIGTIEYDFGDKKIDAILTTPDAASNQKMLAKMVDHKCRFATIEATSIALTQNRLNEIDFDIALFTNFSQDHLDYHQTMEKYLEAKSILFQKLSKDKVALINADEKVSSVLIDCCPAKIKTYGIDKKADYRALDLKMGFSKTTFILEYEDKKKPIEIPLIGKYNVYNTLAAICCALELKEDLDIVIERCKTLKAPSGRLEPITNDLGAQIFIDFAHTEDALKNALLALKETSPKRLITLFGCGGDRDPKKRPQMGKTVSELSNITIITSDNPRTEDPDKICQQVFEGCGLNKEIIIESDRRKAIEKGISILRPGDVLLIAGRGHEKFQIVGKEKVSFQDKVVTEELLEAHKKKALLFL